jgi:hypothetical protein
LTERVRERHATALFNTRQAAVVLLRHHGRMGDKSLKSKQRDQKQKDAAKVEVAAVAKTKQDANVRIQAPAPKRAR